MFLLTKSVRYFYDQEAVKEEAEYGFIDKPTTFDRVGDANRPVHRKPGAWDGKKLGGKKRRKHK